VRRSKIGRVKRAALLSLLLALGCVERKLVIKPDPEDALVFVDGNEIALVGSEAVYRYEHYGIHRVLARKPGYEVKEQLVTLDPPWWQLFPIDLVSDVLWPGKIEDRREVELDLRPCETLQDPGISKELMERAHVMEAEAEGK
jgi:hypothetical protein